ncbi:cystathionine beta-synthase-like [Ochlerotatus camptorhynchus]|uniref:cystathionine beta-synthase-like n=1 Tax=Ochlerotatus camptorhynchus TaxID=644619 RepID=UPI0031E48882
MAHRNCPMNGKAAPHSDFESYFVRPDLGSKCTWKPGTTEASPHQNRAPVYHAKAINNILDAIGNTPLVKLNKIPKEFGVKCNVYVKCEFLNPAGSVKDRIGLRMIEEAEEKGLLKPGATIVEPTSGNTGIGLALAAAVKGYKCVIVMPEKMSNEKVDTLQALGAKVIRTPNEAGFDQPEGLIAVAQRLQRELPNAIILNQYTNSGNPLSHYDGTATEIIKQLDGKVDMVVMGAGTGGTATGLGRKLKEHNPKCKVVCSDPLGSIMAFPESLNKTSCKFWEVEGVGYDFIPTVCDRGVVDEWIKYNDKDALTTARKLIADEGLLCGGSAGGNTFVALQAAKQLKEGQNAVVILPDNIRNHLTKFVSDNWMEARNFMESVNVQNHKWWNNQVSTLDLATPVTITVDVSINEAVRIMKSRMFNQLPVINNDGSIRGVVYLANLIGKLLNGMVQPTDPVYRAIFKQFVKIDRNCTMGRVARILEKDPFVLVTESNIINGNKEQTELVVGLITQRDILHYMTDV